jgi:hypothetical protein
MLGRYCSSVDEDEIEEGLEIVQKQLQSRTVKAGDEELLKSEAKEKGTVKIIDLISAKLDTKNDAFCVRRVIRGPNAKTNDLAERYRLVDSGLDGRRRSQPTPGFLQLLVSVSSGLAMRTWLLMTIKQDPNGNDAGEFATTHWSLVLAAGERGDAE